MPETLNLAMRRCRFIGVILLSVAGCQGWQPTRPAVDGKPHKNTDQEESKPAEIPKVKGASRAPVESTGLDERSREIERNLGAR